MKLNKIVKFGFVLVTICVLITTVMLTAYAVPTSVAGDLPSNTVSEKVTVANYHGTGTAGGFNGKNCGSYMVNGNMALCSYSAGDGLAEYTGTTAKHILGNDTMRAKIMYYLTPVFWGCEDTPSGRMDRLPYPLRGMTYWEFYDSLNYTSDLDGRLPNYGNWRSNNVFNEFQIQDYKDVVAAAMFYQEYYAPNHKMTAYYAANTGYQYIAVHSLMDYVQHLGFTAPSESGTAEAVAKMLYRFVKKYESVIPALPADVRAFIINPYPNQNTQTVTSIERFAGTFSIKKKSTDLSIQSYNSNYDLSGAEYSWYTTKVAAENAARAVAAGLPVPKGSEYVGYSVLNSPGLAASAVATTMIPKGQTTAVSAYKPGTYYIVETKAPATYQLNDKVQSLTLTTDGISHSISFRDPPILGSLKIQKRDLSAIAQNNSLYSLSGAQYTIYKDSDLTQAYDTLTTDEDGLAELNGIPFGTYYIKETKAPKGYSLDTTVHVCDVNAYMKNPVVNSYEPIQTVAAPTLIVKQDAKSSAPLPGAKFVVEYYDKEFDNQTYSMDFVPTKKWLFETDSEGLIKLDAAHLVTEYTDSKGNTVPFSNDDFYFSTSDSSTAVLPQGTLRMYEVEAPIVQGTDGNRYKYKLDDTATIQQVADNGNGVVEYKTVTLYNEIEGALTTTFNGEKIWEDNNNANGNRPDEVTISLYKSVNSRAEIVATTTTNEAKNWKYQFDNLPVTEVINGVPYPIIYYVDEEDVPSGYTCRIRGTNIINHEKSTKVKVNKVWDDNNNQDGIRPASIIVRLYADSVYTGKYTVLSESNNWTDTFDNLPYMKNKEKVNYSVAEYTEESVDSTAYSSTIVSSGTETNQIFKITNKHTPEKTSVVIKKKWNDVADLDRIRPNSVKIKLKGYVNDSIVYESETVTMTAYGNATDDPSVWSVTIQDLDKYFDGKPIEYKATELTLVDGYNLDENGEPQTVTATCEEQEDGTFVAVLENTHVLQRRSMKVYKVWDDDDNRDGLRPSAVSVYLMTVDGNGDKHRYTDENGNEVIGVIQASNDWYYQFTNLPIYDSNRQAIVYSVEEVVPSGYTVSYSGDAANGITITNTHHEEAFVTVNKVWFDGNDQDGIRPDSVTINLKANGTEIDEVELSDDNNWTYTFENLPVHENGQKISYSVSEDDISVPIEFENGYIRRINRTTDSREGYSNYGYIYTVSNTHTPEKRDICVNKVWSDNNNHDGIRPNQVEITLSVVSPSNTGIDDQKGFLSEENNWSYTFKDLPKYHNGQLIQYTVDETDIAIEVSSNGYSKRIQGDMDNGFTITNTHTTEKIKLVIEKVWDDNNDSAHMRPTSATFEVTGYQDQIIPVTLNASNNWKYTLTYDKYYNGVVQEPEVIEVNVGMGYYSRNTLTKSSKSRTTTYTYTFTNTYMPEPTSITVNKSWIDFNDIDGYRPESINIRLYRRPTDRSQSWSYYGPIASLNEDNDWTYTFNGLYPRYIYDNTTQSYIEYEYTVVEEGYSVNGRYYSGTPYHYSSKVEGNFIDGFTIINTYEVPANFDIHFKKFWNDDNDNDGIRPDSINIALIGRAYDDEYGDIIETSRTYATVKAVDNWKYAFTNLPVRYDNGEFIEYSAEEVDTVNGYTQKNFSEFEDGDGTWYYSYFTWYEDYEQNNDSLAIVNEHTSATTSVKINKTWEDTNNQDGVRPASLTFNLLADGNVYRTVTLNDSNKLSTDPNTWTYTFTNLPVYDNGSEITYSVTEGTATTPDGFNDYVSMPVESEGDAESGYTFSFTNRYEPETTQYSVVKRWNDNNDRLGKRPDSLLIILKADGVDYMTYTLTQSDAGSSAANWSHTFVDLPKYKDGVEIQYTAEEKPDSATERLYKNTQTRTTTDSSGYQTTTFTNKVRTATVVLDKKDQEGYGLDGAEFELFFSDGTPLKLSQAVQGIYTYNPTLTTYTNKIVFSNGKAKIQGLPTDAIIIAREVAAPFTYFPYDNDIIIDVQQIIKDKSVTDSSTGVYTLSNITVNNYKTVMPATGGFGDYAIYILAGMFLIGALVFLKKRKDVDL